jgi:hypothetical protein
MNRSYAVKATVVGALAFGALAAVPQNVQAQDELNFTGSANLFDAPGSMGTQLFIDFLTNGSVGGPPTGTVEAIETISGAFLPEVTVGTVGTITDLTVSAAGVVGAPVSPFLTIGGYTFTLEDAPLAGPGPFNFGPITLVDVPGLGTVGFFGVTGTVTGGDYGPTERMFEGLFTAQFIGDTPAEVFAQVNSGGTLPVSYSATFEVHEMNVIPEPSTYILVASGMAVIGVIGRRRARAQAQA